jgi:peptidoglycan-associated lipoprotein
MKKQIQIGALVVLVSLLAACASKQAAAPAEAPKPAPTAPVETAPATPPKSAAELEMEAKAAEEELKRQQLLSEERIYFAYDSSAIDEPSRAIVEAHSIYIMENPDVTVSLEGHCDERGTREYNLALGERRAQSVQKLMAAYGVPAKQIVVVSFGEEKPADPGHDESAWRKNRRVELVYKLK